MTYTVHGFNRYTQRAFGVTVVGASSRAHALEKVRRYLMEDGRKLEDYPELDVFQSTGEGKPL